MIEQRFRPLYQKYCVSMPASWLSTFISPNTVTLGALLFGVFIPVSLYFEYPTLALLCLLISGYFDTLDGTIARLQNNSTQMGSVLDIFTDRAVEFLVILGLFLVSPETRGIYCLLMLGSILLCVSAFLVVGIFIENNANKGFFYSEGLMERAEAFIFFGVMMLLPSLFNMLAILFSLLVTYTALVHLYRFREFIKTHF